MVAVHPVPTYVVVRTHGRDFGRRQEAFHLSRPYLAASCLGEGQYWAVGDAFDQVSWACVAEPWAKASWDSEHGAEGDTTEGPCFVQAVVEFEPAWHTVRGPW